jgi:serpin B
MKRKTTIPVFACILLLASCTNDNTPESPINEPVVIQMSDAESNAILQSTDFGFDLFRRVCAEKGDENVFMSPLSASLTMSMLANGTSGESQAQILSALGYSSDKEGLDALNSINGRLLTTLPITDAQTKLALANAVWADNSYPLKDTFKQTMASVYKATLENLDLNSQDGVDRINRWCSDKTNGLIPKILDGQQLLSYVLVNVLYFKGLWTDKFYVSETESDYFVCQDGSKSLVNMMNIRESMPYFANLDFSITAKDFGNGAFRMYFMLPAEGSTLESSMLALTASNWQSWIDNIPNREINFALPRFSLEGNYVLNDVLKSMGVRNIFSPDVADLSGMSTAGAFVDFVKQKTYIDVNEEGVEAVAATGGAISLGVCPQIKCNRPFIFLIAEKSTGAILFAGKVSSLRSAD